MIELSINGRSVRLDVDPDMPLLWALRDHAGLTGTKYGCGVAQCGACTVHLDGQATRACQLPVSAAVGQRITTIEGIDSPSRRRCRRRGPSSTCRNAATASPGR